MGPYPEGRRPRTSPPTLREHVATSCRVLAAAGQGDLIWGHASARDPEGRGVWMKSAEWGLDEVTPERVHLVAPDGEVLSGDGPRHSEYPIHTEVMAAAPTSAASCTPTRRTRWPSPRPASRCGR